MRSLPSCALSSMDSYILLECLGKGAQGTVYLAEAKEEPVPKTKYVLKKIECHDESEANEAYREALSLQKLNHPYVCHYKDFHVTWEKTTSSMYLCIVMQYYPEGDLRSVIQSFQEKREAVEESVVKKYLGEILEALIFVHKKGVIHRDLKPSNIFLQEDQSVCLGDFGVATVMADACSNTRNTLCTHNYMAPEVGKQKSDEKSDIWALGCILFELCTTFLYNQDQVTAKLKEIKESPLILEDVFEEIAEKFSGNLIRVIREMLKHSHEKRKSTAELLEMEYITECVEMSDVYMVEKKKRQEQTGENIASMPAESSGLLAVLEHIAKSIDQESHVKEGLQQLIGLTEAEDGVSLDDRSKRLVAMAMRNNINNLEVQIAGCSVLKNLIQRADQQDILFTPEIISVVPVAMKQHNTNPELLQTASVLLMAMSSNNSASEVIGQAGGVENIIVAMRSFPDNAELCATCCSALWSLAVNETNLQLACNNTALKDVCAVLKKHMLLPQVAEFSTAALISLSLDDSVLEYVNEIDCVGLLISTVAIHIKQCNVIRNSCIALTGLVESDEECAYRVLTSEDVDGVSGIPVLVRAYQHHKDNAEVVESIVNLIVQLATYDDVNAELRYLSIGPAVLSEVYKRFKPTRDIMSPCEKALDLLGNKQQSQTVAY